MSTETLERILMWSVIASALAGAAFAVLLIYDALSK